MAKIITALVCCILLGFSSYAQDVIIRTDSVQLKAQVLEIGTEQIQFRLFESPDTLVYLISTRDVLEVQLADGTRRTFAQTVRPAQQVVIHNYETDWGRNMVSWSVTDLFVTNLTIAFERYSNSGKLGIKVPVSFGLNADPEMYDVLWRAGRKYAVGLGINFYPFGQGRFAYYLGPMVEMGIADYYYYDYNNTTGSFQELNTARIYTYMLNNGMYYHFSKSYMLVLDIGLGVRTSNASVDNYYDPDSRGARFVIPASLQLGYRF